MDLFSERADELIAAEAPLAARMRPRTLDEVVGQDQLVGPGSGLRSLIEADQLRSVLLWGPPGTGKTSLARVVAGSTRSHFEQLSATSATVKDVRTVLDAARQRLGTSGRRTILFLDEIHRFNRAQQDALLPGVEDRTVVLIGATTENPFFTVNGPLLSRSLLFRLEPLDPPAIATIVRAALRDPERGLGAAGLELEPAALDHLVRAAAGDARLALNALEAAALIVAARGDRTISLAHVTEALQRPRVSYDRAGDQHYDAASAFIKSLRGSDPDAALHYLARMLEAGEDPRFVARRLVILASEDVGLADPRALDVAVAAFQALEYVGLPEAGLNLAEATLYLALAPKSNSVTTALGAARSELAEAGAPAVPGHLQSAGHPGERRLGIGAGYRYPHDHPEHWVEQRHLPEGLAGGYWRPSDQGEEPALAHQWRRRTRAADPPERAEAGVPGAGSQAGAADGARAGRAGASTRDAMLDHPQAPEERHV